MDVSTRLAAARGPHATASAAIIALARERGLCIVGELTIDDVGLDFRVATARDDEGKSWILRIPRREDVGGKIVKEARTLAFLSKRLSVAVPDWQIVTNELVAYPRLDDSTALSFDPETHEVTWHVDRSSPAYTESLATALVELHGIAVEEAKAAGLSCSTPEQARSAAAESLDAVKRELGLDPALERTFRAWLDDDSSWPERSTLVHGDLYAGHTLVGTSGRVTGIIDWTEAEVSDPSIDFTGHLLGFGADGLEALIAEYSRAGGHTWPSMERHVHSRSAFSPVRYGLFALATGDPVHLEAARAQLGVS
ncbi:MAG: macrolide 2'-phosphotransferase [Myxococcales bacterium]|nr:macrolide 2'-phosphotransferase [Myxococcales bacterium]